MIRPRTHAGRVRAVIGLSAGLTLLVALALGWLGWKVVSQEQALDRQRQRERLEQTADSVVSSVLRKVTEVAVAPDAFRPSGAAAEGAGTRPVRVQFERTRVETNPANALLYYPIMPAAAAFPDQDFLEADRLEFQEKDDARLMVVLRTIERTSHGVTRAEALLRLARIQARHSRHPEALDTYSQLRDADIISPSLEVPYSLPARVERCRLLQTAKQFDALDAEISDVRAALRSGRWHMRKPSFVYYDELVRQISGGTGVDDVPPTQLAIADAVNRLWDDWQAIPQPADRSAREWVYRSDQTTIVAIGSATRERLTAGLFMPEHMGQLVLDASSNQFGADGFTVALTDERDAPIAGNVATARGSRAVRTLNVGGLPWRIWVSGPDFPNAAMTAQMRYLVGGLAIVMLIVGVASYAMARGVIREWQTAGLQSDFVSAVSHEFRSPLTTLVQLTELLAERRICDEGRRQTYFEVLQKETVRLQRLVENLLDFGRMEANRREYAHEPIDFAELVRAGVRDYQPEAEQSGYELKLTSSPDALVMHGDREALNRVVRNLLENAVKYSPASRTVWVDTARENGAAVLAVRDEGMGIAAAEQPRIFDKFVRGEAAKQACIQGTGIGLAMVQEVVKAHHGDVDVVSELGVGSTFTVRLPLMTAAAESAA